MTMTVVIFVVVVVAVVVSAVDVCSFMAVLVVVLASPCIEVKNLPVNG